MTLRQYSVDLKKRNINCRFRFKCSDSNRNRKKVWYTANMENKFPRFERRPLVKEKCAIAFHIGTTEYAVRFFLFSSIYYLHSHVKTHSLFLHVDRIEHVWAGHLEHGCWEACSCMLGQPVHGLLEQSW